LLQGSGRLKTVGAPTGNTNSFRGGTRVDTKDYLVIKSGPMRDVRVHIAVAEAMLKRKLKPDETVHHKDGDKKNPHWSNLLVVGRDVHGAVSHRQKWYLKQKYSQEEAAWRAFHDVTGKTYTEYEDTSFNTEEL
jgi:hypothetical protein